MYVIRLIGCTADASPSRPPSCLLLFCISAFSDKDVPCPTSGMVSCAAPCVVFPMVLCVFVINDGATKFRLYCHCKVNTRSTSRYCRWRLPRPIALSVEQHPYPSNITHITTTKSQNHKIPKVPKAPKVLKVPKVPKVPNPSKSRIKRISGRLKSMRAASANGCRPHKLWR